MATPATAGGLTGPTAAAAAGSSAATETYLGSVGGGVMSVESCVGLVFGGGGCFALGFFKDPWEHADLHDHSLGIRGGGGFA